MPKKDVEFNSASAWDMTKSLSGANRQGMQRNICVLWTYLLAAARFGAEECCPLLWKLKTTGNRIYLSHCEQGLEEWGSEPNRPKCKRRSYSFSTRILTKRFELKEEVFNFFFDMKRVEGMVILQKLEKALVHSGDVTMNICFFKVGKKLLYSSHCFLRGSCGSSDKALGYGLDDPGSILGVGGVEILFTPLYPDYSWGPLSLL